MLTTLRRLVAAALIAPIVALAAAAPAQAQTGKAPANAPKKPKPHLRLTGQFGWGGRIDTKTGQAFSGVTQTGRWFPIWIEIENLREKEVFKGTIRVTPSGVDHSSDRFVEMSSRVAIAPGSRARVRFAYRTWSRDNAGNVSFRISAIDSLTAQTPRGGAVGSLRAPAHVADGQLVVVVGDTTVSKLVSHLQEALGSTAFGAGAASRSGSARPIMMLPADLPARFAEYDAADVIVWPRVEGDPITAAQKEGMGEWVRAGGTLIVGVGDTAPSGAVTQLFPAGIGAPVKISRFDSLPVDVAAIPQRPERVLNEVLRPLTSDRRNPADARWVEQTGSGPVAWVVTRDFGAGQVVLVGADLLAAPFREDAKEWWRTLAGWPGPVPSAKDPDGPADGPGPRDGLQSTKQQNVQGWGEVYTGWEGQPAQLAFTTAIADVKAAQDIPFGWLALFLGIYVLLVGPVDYLILKRINRLEWTFASFTVITVIATGGAWGVSQYLKGGDMLLRAVEIHTSRANAEGARSEAVWGIFSNAHDELTLNHSDPTAATGLFWVPANERGGIMGKQCVVESTPRGVYTPVAPVRIWTTDWFHSVWSNSRGVTVEGVLTETADGEPGASGRQAPGAAGVLKLTGKQNWRNVYCVYGDAIWLVTPQWTAGEEITIDPQSRSDVNSGTAEWEKPPSNPRGEQLYSLEEAAWNAMALSVGRRVGDVGAEADRDRWATSLACRPPPGMALLIGMSAGNPEVYRVPRHAPTREAVAVERVWVAVKPRVR